MSESQKDTKAPAPVLKAYPPEASPLPEDDTPPVMVPGEQASPLRRLPTFPEDVARDAAGDGPQTPPA